MIISKDIAKKELGNQIEIIKQGDLETEPALNRKIYYRNYQIDYPYNSGNYVVE